VDFATLSTYGVALKNPAALNEGIWHHFLRNGQFELADVFLQVN